MQTNKLDVTLKIDIFAFAKAYCAKKRKRSNIFNENFLLQKNEKMNFRRSLRRMGACAVCVSVPVCVVCEAT